MQATVKKIVGLSKRTLLTNSLLREGGEEGALKGGGGEDRTSRETSEGVDTLEVESVADKTRGGRVGSCKTSCELS